MKLVIDATYSVVGRVASYAAKQALLGHEVIIVNAEKGKITGRPKMVLERYQKTRARGGTSQKGPNFPSRPEFIFKRTIRGMLSYKQGRGREAFKKIRCYVGVPPEFTASEKITLAKDSGGRYLTLEQLSQQLKR